MSWFWTIIVLGFTFSSHFSEAKHLKKLPSDVVVVGTVYCDTCFHRDFPKASHFISGASVAVECKDTTSTTPSFQQQTKTNEHGEFKIHLPLSISKHLNKIKGCSVKLLTSNHPYCSISATATSSSSVRKQGTHIFSAGFFTFKPLNQPEICSQKPSINNNNKAENLSPITNPNDPAFPPPLKDPPPSDPPALGGLLPKLPLLPPLPQLPQLPKIPLLPPLPNNKNTAKPSQTQGNKVIRPTQLPFPFPFPPNPLLPPPSLLPPNPLLPPPSIIPPVVPSPPASIFPPLFPTPSAPPFFTFPPVIPGFTPSPPPPALPTLPIPLPPFPFQPTPGFPGPGVPPANKASADQSKTESP